MDRPRLRPSQRPLYDNYLMLHPDGTPMCRLSTRKAQFYLKNGIAEVVSPSTIQLLFEPGGRGQAGNTYMLSDRQSRCVVCGRTDNLTRHHVVPYCYRRHLPRRYTMRASNFDVLAVCVEDHLRYEALADQLKQEIADELGVERHGTIPKVVVTLEDWLRSRASASANALVRYRDQMPEERVQSLLKRVAAHLGREPNEEDLIDVANTKANLATGISHGKQVAEKITDVYAFVVRWRRHFIESMKPAFLDPNWDPEQRFDD